MIDFDMKEAGKLIGLGKAVFTRAKTKTVKVVMDTIEDYEQEYFANDLKLAGLVKEKQGVVAKAESEKKRLDGEIQEHIDDNLRCDNTNNLEEECDPCYCPFGYSPSKKDILKIENDVEAWGDLSYYDEGDLIDDLIQLLRDCLHEFDTMSGLSISDSRVKEEERPVFELEFNNLQERLGNTIKVLEDGE